MFDLFIVMLAISSPIWIVVLIIAFFKHKTSTTETLNTLRQTQDEEITIRLKKDVEQLSERVQVLEAIVTDSGYQLHSEISQLNKNNSTSH